MRREDAELYSASMLVIFVFFMCFSSSFSLSMPKRGSAKSKPEAKRASAQAKTTTSSSKTSSTTVSKKGGNNACSKYCGPKYFVGGAFAPLMKDMSERKMSEGVGYHLHPMGFAVAKDGGYLPKLLSNFSTKHYLYEMDLDAWTDGSNPVQTNTPGVWGDFLNDAAGGWKCAVAAPWAKSADMANPESAIRKYNQLFSKIRAWGCKQCWIFWSPPSEPNYNATVLKNQTYATIAKATGATGICVDHPGQRSDSFDVSIAAMKWAKANGLGAGWIFNGTATTNEVAAMMKRIKDAGVKLDFAASDNFSNPNTGWSSASAELAGMKGL